MRRYLGFMTAIMAIALATAIWAKPGAVATTDGFAQSRTGISPYEMMSNAKGLPITQVADYF